MAVPKKRTSISKKHIRKNFWKKKGYWAALKAFSIAKSLYSGNSTLFIEKKNKKKSSSNTNNRNTNNRSRPNPKKSYNKLER